jgi:hypothetical protein
LIDISDEGNEKVVVEAVKSHKNIAMRFFRFGGELNVGKWYDIVGMEATKEWEDVADRIVTSCFGGEETFVVKKISFLEEALEKEIRLGSGQLGLDIIRAGKGVFSSLETTLPTYAGTDTSLTGALDRTNIPPLVKIFKLALSQEEAAAEVVRIGPSLLDKEFDGNTGRELIAEKYGEEFIKRIQDQVVEQDRSRIMELVRDLP